MSRLLTPLKWLGRKLVEAFDALLSEHAGHLKKLGALLAAGLLAKRLPGPLRWISQLLVSTLQGERGFGFWWLAVTVGIALAIGALLALLVSPVAAIVALLAVGIWMLIARARKKDDEGDASDREGDASDREGDASDRASKRDSGDGNGVHKTRLAPALS